MAGWCTLWAMIPKVFCTHDQNSSQFIVNQCYLLVKISSSRMCTQYQEEKTKYQALTISEMWFMIDLGIKGFPILVNKLRYAYYAYSVGRPCLVFNGIRSWYSNNITRTSQKQNVVFTIEQVAGRCELTKPRPRSLVGFAWICSRIIITMGVSPLF